MVTITSPAPIYNSKQLQQLRASPRSLACKALAAGRIFGEPGALKWHGAATQHLRPWTGPDPTGTSNIWGSWKVNGGWNFFRALVACHTNWCWWWWWWRRHVSATFWDQCYGLGASHLLRKVKLKVVLQEPSFVLSRICCQKSRSRFWVVVASSGKWSQTSHKCLCGSTLSYLGAHPS